ncbi:MAG: hypothetical protein V4608_10930 [Bacteroidota bacterium]
MLSEVIEYLNVQLADTGYINDVLCLAERIEREGKIYPAIYNNKNEYISINLDPNGSLSYWRKNGDVNISEEDNQTLSCGIQYKTTIPLKLIGFVKKENAHNTSTFSDTMCQNLIAVLTTNSAVLKGVLKAKKATLIASGYSTDVKKILGEEYDNIDFEVRYSHAYFSIDFNLVVITNSNCYQNFCDQIYTIGE